MAIPDADGCLQNWKLGVAVLGLFTCTLAQIASSSVAFNLPLTYPRRGWSIISAAGKIGPSNSIRRIENIEDPLLTITTFNVLAPIFKRVGMDDRRESEFRDAYLKRNAAILEHLKGTRSDVICLQELWVANQEMMDMYRSSLEGYQMFTLPRTGSRGDGLACFVKDGIEVLDRQDLRLKDIGGRVALVLHLRVPGVLNDGGMGKAEEQRREVVVANTHLLFPHARTFFILRTREVRKLLAFMECYTQTQDLGHLPVVLCGDFNGRSAGRIYKHLSNRGFRCSFEDTLGPDGDRSRWITHRNHLGEELGVDYVWYRNPHDGPTAMESDWEQIVYQSTKQQLLNTYPSKPYVSRSDGTPFLCEKASAGAVELGRVNLQELSEREQLDSGASVATRNGELNRDGGSNGEDMGSWMEEDRLSAALRLQGLREGFEFSEEEIKLLLDNSADDFDFLVPTIFDGSSIGLEGAARMDQGWGSGSRPSGCRLETSSSRIRPEALEQGKWPQDYTMSDHGSLTVTFRVQSIIEELKERDPDGDSALTDSEDDGADLNGYVARALAPHTFNRGIHGIRLDEQGTMDYDAKNRVDCNRGGAIDWRSIDDGHYGLR